MNASVRRTPNTESVHVDADIAELLTVRDLYRYAVSRFGAHNLVYGHGTTNAVDEAAFIISESLHLTPDSFATLLDARLLAAERVAILDLINLRITSRRPASYLVAKAYIRGVPFYVDQRVIVPRSFIGHMLQSKLIGSARGALVRQPQKLSRVLDLCTGSGCLAILAARCFPAAIVDAVDLSVDALAVAKRNVDDAGLAHRIRLLHGDLLDPVLTETYDLILSNPPYVSAADMDALPQEYRHEPRMALAGGADGLDFVRAILNRAPALLRKNGGLLCEIGAGRSTLEREYSKLIFRWFESDAVFWLKRPAGSRRRTT